MSVKTVLVLLSFQLIYLLSCVDLYAVKNDGLLILSLQDNNLNIPVYLKRNNDQKLVSTGHQKSTVSILSHRLQRRSDLSAKDASKSKPHNSFLRSFVTKLHVDKSTKSSLPQRQPAPSLVKHSMSNVFTGKYSRNVPKNLDGNINLELLTTTKDPVNKSKEKSESAQFWEFLNIKNPENSKLVKPEQEETKLIESNFLINGFKKPSSEKLVKHLHDEINHKSSLENSSSIYKETLHPLITASPLIPQATIKHSENKSKTGFIMKNFLNHPIFWPTLPIRKIENNIFPIPRQSILLDDGEDDMFFAISQMEKYNNPIYEEILLGKPNLFKEDDFGSSINEIDDNLKTLFLHPKHKVKKRKKTFFF